MMEQQPNELLTVSQPVPIVGEISQPPVLQRKRSTLYVVGIVIFTVVGFLGLVGFRAIYSTAKVLLPTYIPAEYKPIGMVQKQGPVDFGQVYVRGEQMFIYAQRPLPNQLICKKPAPDSTVSDYVVLAIPGAVEACSVTLQTAGGY